MEILDTEFNFDEMDVIVSVHTDHYHVFVLGPTNAVWPNKS